MTGTALILGASGRFGDEAAEAFWNAGWRIRLFDGEADTLEQSARGVDVIVNGWNPGEPGRANALAELTDQVIAAARATGATVLISGQAHGKGHDGDRFNPAKPARAHDQMEQAYRDAGVRTIVLGSGDLEESARQAIC